MILRNVLASSFGFLVSAVIAIPSTLARADDLRWLEGNAKHGRALITNHWNKDAQSEIEIENYRAHGAFTIAESYLHAEGRAEVGVVTLAKVDANSARIQWKGEVDHGRSLPQETERRTRDSLESWGMEYPTWSRQPKPWTCADRNGLQQRFHPNGLIAVEYTCRDGLVNGKYQTFNELGFVEEDWPVVAGWIQGTAKVYDLFSLKEADFDRGVQTSPLYIWTSGRRDRYCLASKVAPLEAQRPGDVEQRFRSLAWTLRSVSSLESLSPEVTWSYAPIHPEKRDSLNLGALVTVGSMKNHSRYGGWDTRGLRLGILSMPDGKPDYVLDLAWASIDVVSTRYAVGYRRHPIRGGALQPEVDFGLTVFMLQLRLPYYFERRTVIPEYAFGIVVPLRVRN